MSRARRLVPSEITRFCRMMARLDGSGERRRAEKFSRRSRDKHNGLFQRGIGTARALTATPICAMARLGAFVTLCQRKSSRPFCLLRARGWRRLYFPVSTRRARRPIGNSTRMYSAEAWRSPVSTTVTAWRAPFTTCRACGRISHRATKCDRANRLRQSRFLRCRFRIAGWRKSAAIYWNWRPDGGAGAFRNPIAWLTGRFPCCVRAQALPVTDSCVRSRGRRCPAVCRSARDAVGEWVRG